jgi:hypothetical protein
LARLTKNRAPTDKSFCFFFQKEVLAYFRYRSVSRISMPIARASNPQNLPSKPRKISNPVV